uniref:Poly [ADP-ribose] polymerase n=1 Tax=Sarcophilus harrisii TaxID=9305 RepID=A0A7N4UZA8_SARHA
MSGSVTSNGPHLRTCCKRASGDKDLKDPSFSLQTVKPCCGPFMRVTGRQPRSFSVCSRNSKDWKMLDHLQSYPSTNEILHVTPEEFHLWKVLQETLDFSLWKVKVGWQLVENSAIISFSGPQKVVSNAKTAISKLMILLNSTVRMNPWPGLIQEQKKMSGFFQVGNGLSLYLWKGEASTFRASVIMSLSSGPLDRQNKVKPVPKVRVQRQHILNDRGIPQVLLQVVLSSSWAGHSSGRKLTSRDESQELTASAVTLALQAASQEKSASLVIHPTGPTALAKGITQGVKAFKNMQPMGSSLKNLTVAVTDDDFVAEWEVECCRWWPSGKNLRVLLPYVMSSWEAVTTEVVFGSLFSQKTDVVVFPWILEPHNKSWVQETTTQVRTALETILTAQNLVHGNIITIPASSLPGLHCQILYIICLDVRLVQQCLEVSKVIQQVVWSCLDNFLGSFLESISFPILDLETTGNSNSLCIMLEEINNFLKQKPNTWMKLVQIIQPLQAATPQKMTEYFRTPLEMSIPQHWEPMDDNPVKTVKLSSNQVEYQRVAQKFKYSMNKTTILKIERIQNPYLWTSYIYKRNWMEKKNPPGVQNEQFLFHGTKAKNCSSIIENGLKSTCRKNGRYGQGIYFAVDAYMSSQFCGKGCQGSKFLFQVRVLTGEYVKGDSELILPPRKPGGGRYDSLVDSMGMPRIFVTFFDDHSYPEYLITFC